MEPEKTKKHPLKKFLSLFLKSDLPTVKRHFIMDVMVPKITELIVDGVKETADVLFYGESAPSKQKQRPGTYISYNNYSKAPSTKPVREQREYLYHPEIDFPFNEYYNAKEKLDILIEMIDVHADHNLTVSEFYSEMGATSTNYMDEHFGWTDLSTAKIVRRNGQYYLNFPRCIEIHRN